MKILVGYKKGKTLGEELLELALVHGMAFKAKVMVVTSMAEGNEEDQDQITEAEAALKRARIRFDQKGVECQTHLLIRGLSPSEDILAFAEENRIDEIILGVKSRSKVGKLLFGSTAQAVILQAKCPVVTLR